MKKPARNKLLNMPIGTKITTGSKSKGYKKYVKFSEGYFISEDGLICSISRQVDEGLKVDSIEELETKIIKIEKPHYETIWKEKEILDEVEKKYLSAVIKPFKSRIQTIAKLRGTKKEFIRISLKDEDISFPYFKSKTKYKNMKENKEYTLKELGL